MTSGLRQERQGRITRTVLVRDSKDSGGPSLAFTQPVWRRFVVEVQRGDHDVRPSGLRGSA
ncbi:MAG: DUF397 domain-containing protein [Streptosporangiaceae bacterium]